MLPIQYSCMITENNQNAAVYQNGELLCLPTSGIHVAYKSIAICVWNSRRSLPCQKPIAGSQILGFKFFILTTLTKLK